MKRLLPAAALAFFTFALPAQTVFSKGWSIWCEYEQNNLQQTSDGGYILCTDAVPEMDTVNNLAWCYLLKLDAMGTQQWAVQFAKSSYFIKASDGNAVVQTSDGGFAVATTMYTQNPTQTNSHTAIYIVKTNSMGGLLWSKQYPGLGNSSANCIKTTNDHGLIVSGVTRDTVLNVSHAYLMRLDSSGNVVWANEYSQTGPNPTGNFVTATQTFDGGFIIGGNINNAGLVMKTDGSGNVLWTQQCDSASYSDISDVMETTDGFYVSSATDYYFPGAAVLRKYDLWGNWVWGYSYPRSMASSTSSTDYAYSVEESTSGYTFSISGNGMTAGLVHVDTSGTPQWAKLYKDSYVFHPIALEYTTDLGYALCTSNYDFMAPNFAGWRVNILKVDSVGKAACHDSTIVDSMVAIVATNHRTVSLSSVTPVIPVPTVLHYVLVPDTNYCITPDAINEVAVDHGMNVYPNPSSTEVHVELYGINGYVIQLRLFNSLGQEVRPAIQSNAGEYYNFTIAGLPDGIYFLQLNVDGQIAETKRLCVQH